MSSIIAAGLGSGLDIDGIVRQLVAAEGAPQQTRLGLRETQLQAKLSAFGQFRSAIEQLRQAVTPLKSLQTFQGRQVTVGDEAQLGVTAAANAPVGRYAVEVLQLSGAQKLASGPLGSAQAAVGDGTLTLTAGGTTFDVVIDGSANTLADVASAINDAAGNSAVRATLITADDGTRLVLTSRQSGSANTITVTASGGDGGLAQLAYDPANSITNLTQIVAAQDAQVSVDGFVYTSPDDVVTEVLSGLTLNLKAAAPGNPTTLAVDTDPEGSSSKVEAFVQAYNNVITSLKSLTSYNADTQSGGPLLGDSTARSFLSAVRSEVSRAVGGSATLGSLTELGITTELDGTLEIDSGRLSEALGARFDAAGLFFSTAETGLAARLDKLFAQYVDGNGLISARTDGLQASIQDIADAREALAERLVLVEARLRRQFTALDTLVGQLRNTGDFLTQQLGNLLPTNQQSTR